MSQPYAAADPPPPPAPAAARRPRWRRLLVGLVAGLLLLVLLAPSALSFGPTRRLIFGAVLMGQDLSVEFGSLRLGWFRSLEARDFALRKGDGPPIVTAGSLTGDRTLLARLLAPRDLGTLKLADPRVRIVLADDDDGLLDVVKRKDNEVKTPQRVARPIQLLGRFTVQGAEVLVAGGVSQHEWTIGDLNVTAQLTRPADRAASLLTIEPGTLLDRVQLSPGVCNDLLKFIAPHLADVAAADGEFSLKLDHAHAPLDAPLDFAVQGELVVHSAEVSPGPLIRTIAEFLGVEHLLSAPIDTPIAFHVEDRKVWHEGLAFRLGKIEVRTRGGVGFDQSLDLEVEVPMPAHLLREGAMRDALSHETLLIPVEGTLKEPKIDAKVLAQSGFDVLRAALGAIAHRDARETPETNAEGTSSPAAAEPGEPKLLDDEALQADLIERGVEAGQDLFEALRQRRARRLAEQGATAKAAEAEPASAETESREEPATPRKRIFQRLRRRAAEPEAK